MNAHTISPRRLGMNLEVTDTAAQQGSDSRIKSCAIDRLIIDVRQADGIYFAVVSCWRIRSTRRVRVRYVCATCQDAQRSQRMAHPTYLTQPPYINEGMLRRSGPSLPCWCVELWISPCKAAGRLRLDWLSPAYLSCCDLPLRA